MTRRWPEVELGTIAVKLQDGPFGSNLKSSHYVEDGVRVVRLQNIGPGYFDDSNRAFIDCDHFKKLSKHECFAGDVLIATLGDPIVRAAVLPPTIPVALNKADCIQLRCHPDRAVPGYVSHYLNSPLALGHAEARSHGQTRPRVNLSQLRTMPIPLPPIKEQQRIAAVLDAADELRAKRRQALAKIETLAQTIFIDMFGDPERATGRVCKLTDLADLQIGYPFKSSTFTSNGTGIRICRGANVLPGKVSWKDTARVPAAVVAERSEFELLEGDVVVGMDRPWISSGFKVALIGEEDVGSLLVQRVARLRARGEVPAAYVYQLLRLPAFTRHCAPTETTIPHISPNDFRSFEVQEPSITKLSEFRKAVNRTNMMRGSLHRSHCESEALFLSLQQRAFRGEL